MTAAEFAASINARVTEPTVSLLQGKPYVQADKTDIRATLERFKTKPPKQALRRAK